MYPLTWRDSSLPHKLAPCLPTLGLGVGRQGR